MAGIDIKAAFKTANEGVNGITTVGTGIIISLIVLGSIIGAVTTGGIILPSAFNTVLNSLSAVMSGWFTSVTGVVTTIVALIVVVVLIALFLTKKGGESGGSMI